MSCEVNTIAKERLMDKVDSMTVMEFQDAIEKAGLEGNSVIEDETILSYFPFKSDSNLSEEKQNQIIESLYSTGFFN